MKKRYIFILLGILLTLYSSLCYAERYVVVNGKRLSYAEIQYFERLSCGYIADGRYWYDARTGLWGFANNPIPMGHISDNCYQQPHDPSLSERGLLYSPGELLR